MSPRERVVLFCSKGCLPPLVLGLAVAGPLTRIPLCRPSQSHQNCRVSPPCSSPLGFVIPKNHDPS